MKKMSRISGIILIVCLGVFMGCNKAEAKKPGIKIGIALSSSDEFNTNLRRNYEEYAKTLDGVNLSFAHASSAAGQVTDIENLVSQGCDVLIVRSVDNWTATPAVNTAKKAGLKIILDEAVLDGADYDAIITGDQLSHGIILGEYLKRQIDNGVIEKAKIGYIAGVSTLPGLDRKNGISEVLNSSEHEFVTGGSNGYELADNWSAIKAQELVENWITSGAINNINVIACMNDEIANGAIAALGTNYPQIIVLGVDGSLVGQANIRNGRMKVTTFQDTKKLTQAIIDTALKIYNGGTVEFSDPQNKVVDPKHISFMTPETIDALVGTSK
jgi:ABC-type sugar transport system substrate-binding protein